MLRGMAEPPDPLPADPAELAARIKGVALPLTGVQGLSRANSSAGGVALDAVDLGDPVAADRCAATLQEHHRVLLVHLERARRGRVA